MHLDVIRPNLARQRIKRAGEHDGDGDDANPQRGAPNEPADCRCGRCAYALERCTLGCLSPVINHMPICRLTKSAPRLTPVTSLRPPALHKFGVGRFNKNRINCCLRACLSNAIPMLTRRKCGACDTFCALMRALSATFRGKISHDAKMGVGCDSRVLVQRIISFILCPFFLRMNKKQT